MQTSSSENLFSCFSCISWKVFPLPLLFPAFWSFSWHDSAGCLWQPGRSNVLCLHFRLPGFGLRRRELHTSRIVRVTFVRVLVFPSLSPIGPNLHWWSWSLVPFFSRTLDKLLRSVSSGDKLSSSRIPEASALPSHCFLGLSDFSVLVDCSIAGWLDCKFWPASFA